MIQTPQTVDLFGFRCMRASIDEAAADAGSAVAGRSSQRILFLNAAKVTARECDYHPLLNAAERLYADGQSIVIAARMAGEALPQRVAGIDLMERLLRESDRNGWRIFLLGATEETLAKAGAAIRERFPGAVIAGSRNGFFDAAQDTDIAEVVRATSPDLVFVALPSPRKEEWVMKLGPRTGAPVVMAVGGSLDVLAGAVSRAPVIVQRIGLEWAWRVLQEPGRLWRRYAGSNIRFMIASIRQAFRLRFTGPRSDSRR